MMMQFRSLYLLALLSPAVAGCISTAELQAPVPEDVSIAVLTPGHPQKMVFGNYADAKSFIPLYGFAKQAQAIATEPVINTELAARGFRVAEELQRALIRDIQLNGIDANAVRIARDAERIPSALSTSELPDGHEAWALMDARITGYGVLADMSGEFRPFVCVIARLIDARTRKVLYDKRFAYNYSGSKVVRIPFEPADKWSSIEAVRDDVPGVQAAIGRGFSKITKLIAADLAAK